MSNLISQVKDIVHEDVNLCYQCEKCTSGCPVSMEMELVPAQIMHASQLNMKEKILKANTIWLCASCETCTTRCPQGEKKKRNQTMPGLTVDEMKKMREDSKKEMSLREGNFRGKVIVHLGTCGIAAGAREVMDALFEEVDKRDIIDIMFTSSGCAGLCSKEPMITVEIGTSPPVKYGKLTPGKVLKILDEHIIGGRVVKEFAIGMGSERIG